jgi:hypothetical protein
MSDILLLNVSFEALLFLSKILKAELTFPSTLPVNFEFLDSLRALLIDEIIEAYITLGIFSY